VINKSTHFLAVKVGTPKDFHTTIDSICEYLLGHKGKYAVYFLVPDLQKLLHPTWDFKNISKVLALGTVHGESYCWDEFGRLFTESVRYYEPYIIDNPKTSWGTTGVLVEQTEYSYKAERLIAHKKLKEYLESLPFLNLE